MAIVPKRVLAGIGQVVSGLVAALPSGVPMVDAGVDTRFDGCVNALNRLPRPTFAFGVIALFLYAVAAPDAFAVRMAALSAMPDQLWWLVGGVVGFHFGAREAYYPRGRGAGLIDAGLTGAQADASAAALPGADDPNPALEALTRR